MVEEVDSTGMVVLELSSGADVAVVVGAAVVGAAVVVRAVVVVVIEAVLDVVSPAAASASAWAAATSKVDLLRSTGAESAAGSGVPTASTATDSPGRGSTAAVLDSGRVRYTVAATIVNTATVNAKPPITMFCICRLIVE
jgi:hypothetical protein